MWLPNGNTTSPFLHMHEIQYKNLATYSESSSSASGPRQASAPQKMNSNPESLPSRSSSSIKHSSSSARPPLSQIMQQSQSVAEAVARPGSGDWLGHLQRLGSCAGFAVTRVEQRCGGRCRGGGRRCDPSKVSGHVTDLCQCKECKNICCCCRC